LTIYNVQIILITHTNWSVFLEVVTIKASYDLKQTILDTAINILHEKSYHKTSVDEIVKEAGTTKGGFYYYFQNKEDLLYQIHEKFMENELNYAMEVYHKKELSTETKLRMIISDLIKSINDHRSYVVIFFRERHNLTSDHLEKIVKKRDHYFNIVKDLIGQGIKEGRFRKDLDSAVIALGLFGMCDWTYQWYREDGKYSTDDVAKMFTEIFFNGILK